MRPSRPAHFGFGSSPLAWGTAIPEQAVRHRHRFIPTRVGNSPGALGRRHWSSVHPHSRGEQLAVWKSTPLSCGSSPLAWGTEIDTVSVTHIVRFIPTRVGNSFANVLFQHFEAVHPHSRGEQYGALGMIGVIGGSSPLAWGTDRPTTNHIQTPRFIPTRVGNSQYMAEPIPTIPVHPHSRGEQLQVLRVAEDAAGSSPLAWGTVTSLVRVGDGVRFIPTRVGNSPGIKPGPPPSAVHPHSRGEQDYSLVDGVELRRFIPTRVGNRRPDVSRSHAGSVHPHSRGEQPLPPTSIVILPGSSPLAWGTGSIPF